MSYPYDINPWDDNPNPANQPPQQIYTAGFSVGDVYSNQQQEQYSLSYGNQAYQYQDQPQQQQYSEADLHKPTEEEQAKPEQQPSALGRFLRQHVPICGAFMDTMSSINLPFIDALVQHINRDLLISKIFYFFFYSAFGSLFPLMGVYFKQLGMNPAQVGILTGVRPFIEIFSAPFWHSLAQRFHKAKALLLFSLLSWIVFTYSLAHIRPPASACVAFNDTYYVLYTPYSANDLSNADIGQLEESSTMSSTLSNEMFINKPPSNEKEGKDAILASEENQNDQKRRRRRRRRRKRQASSSDMSTISDSKSRGSNSRFLYSIEGKDEGYESIDLDVGDLSNDYEDRPVSVSTSLADKRPSYSSDFVANSDSYDVDAQSSDEPNELQQSISRGLRFERSLSMKDEDDLLGESDEPDEEELKAKEEEEEARRKEKERERKRKEEEATEAEEQESSVGDEQEGSSEANASDTGSGDKRKTTTTGRTFSSTTTTSATTTVESFEPPSNNQANKTKRVYKQRHKTPPTHIVGMSPITVEYAINYNKEKHSKFVTPMFSTIVYKLDDIKEVFVLLLLLISLGEFFSAPAITLADSATLSYLGKNTDLYGRQRLFGSLSWAITLLLVGMALDNATSIADHPCGPHQRERSYTVCFIIFSLLMACALLTATQFRFNYSKAPLGSNGSQALIASTTSDSGSNVVTTTVAGDGNANVADLYASTQPRSIFNTAPPVNAPPPTVQEQQQVEAKEKFEFLDKWKSAVFAQNTKELPEWVNVFRQFKNSLHLMYLFITWFLGCGVGLVFTFLFWHLQDVGGTPTLFGICSVINHISEIMAYFFSFSFIKRFGHTRVLSIGLGCNAIRFVYVAFLTNPYYALPFELVQGITHAACFAACCSYISHQSKPELRTSTQGVMQGLHHGIGRACGTLIGGYMINAIGSRASFCIYGLLSGCVLAGFLYVRKKASEMEETEVKVDELDALGGYGAPQGVPSAIPGKIAVDD